MIKKPLNDVDLLHMMELGLSDIDILSDDSDEGLDWGSDGLEDVEIIKIEGTDFEEIVECKIEVLDAKVQDEFEDPMEGVSGQNKNLPVDIHAAKQNKETAEARVLTFMAEYEFTAEENIVWMQNVTYETPIIKWHQEKREKIVEELPSPMSFFEKYFTRELFECMVENTNLYATQKNSEFRPVTFEEILTFVGIHVIMGNCHYPRVRCYWQPILSISLVSNNMPINRFYKLRQHLHFVNIEEKPNNNDRLWKIRPLFDTIQSRCNSLKLETDLCIDEQMIPFKGSLNIKQHVKNKPTKWGIKLYALCGKSGLCYDFIIHQGDTTELNTNHVDIFGSGAAVITTLVRRITEANHRLFFGSYFSNYNALQYLKNLNIYATCIARVDRFGKPPFSSDETMKIAGRGSVEEVVSKDGIIMTNWFDNKRVVMASNYRGVGVSDTCCRWDKTRKEYIDVRRPEVVKEYNICMRGVDKLEFLISLHRTFISSKKWTLRMFAHALDLSLANAWLEYKKQAEILAIPKKDLLDLLGFRAYIAEGLIKSNRFFVRRVGHPSASPSIFWPKTPKREGFPQGSRQGTSSLPGTSKSFKHSSEIGPISEVRYDQIGHFPSFDKKTYASRCKYEKCKGQSRVQCLKCEVHLCLNKSKNCFLSYHVKK